MARSPRTTSRDTDEIALASAKTRTLERKPKPISSTTIRALERKPASGGGYSVLKPTEPVDARIDVVADATGIQIEVDGRTVPLTRSEAKLLADKLARALK